jgi:transposase
MNYVTDDEAIHAQISMKTADRWLAIALVEELGQSHRAVAKRMGVPHNTIDHLVAKHKRTGEVEDIPRSGRPRTLTPRQRNSLTAAIQVDPRASAATLQRALVRRIATRVSERTVRRERRRAGFVPRRPPPKPALTQQQKHDRIVWARRNQATSWNSRIFEDEAVFYLRRDRRVLWAKAGETVPRPEQSPRGKITVAGAVSSKGLSPLVFLKTSLTSQLFCDVVEDDLVPWANADFPQGWDAQWDNSGPHTAKKAVNHMAALHVTIVAQPAQSPDLQPMELMWSYLKDSLQVLELTSVKEMERQLVRIWNSVPDAQCKRTIEHVKSRLSTVIRSKGEICTQ